MKILIVCIDNSCLSPIAEAFLKHFDPNLEIFSAGFNPTLKIHPLAVEVMKEINIDISQQIPKHISEFANYEFEYIITICDKAHAYLCKLELKTKKLLNIHLFNPSKTNGSQQQIFQLFRIIRDQIRKKMFEFYRHEFLLNY